MKLAVIGTGYVGLVSGACFADRGHEVVCVDVLPEKVAALNAGKIPIHEPGLEEVVARNRANGRLTFTTSYADAVPGAEVVLLAVGTPSAADGSADLQYVFAAVDAAAANTDRACLFVTKSTVPVGTAKKIEARLAGSAFPHVVASNPEMLRESRAVEDFLFPSRLIFGVRDEKAKELLERLYAAWDCRRFTMSPESAELTKYANNTFLAVKISFINELAQLATAFGADIRDVADGIGSDPRIGRSFLQSGLGWGGSCFPKDVSALLHMAAREQVDVKIAQAAVSANRDMRAFVVAQVEKEIGGVTGKTIALLGLAFKGGTDDTRASPALELAAQFAARGATVIAHDPKAVVLDAAVAAAFQRVEDPYVAATGADAIVLATEWDEYRELELARLKAAMRGDLVFDARNLLEPAAVRAAGLRYAGIGNGR
jgi:UDPglucose 6-dehydrogenase